MEVEGCANSVKGRCIFVKGQSYKISVKAKASKSNTWNNKKCSRFKISNAFCILDAIATELPYTAAAMILGLPVTLFEGDACDDLVIGSCPAQENKVFKSEKSIVITNRYPEVKSTIKVEVKDETNNPLICVKIKFATVKAKSED